MKPETLPLRTIDAAKEYMLASFRQFESIVGNKDQCKRFFAIALNCVEQNHKLLSCSRNSFRNALIEAARLDLEPNSIQQLAWLIPRGGIIRLEPGYRGLCQLVLRDGGVRRIWAQAVYDDDEFRREEGVQHVLIHNPKDPWRSEDPDRMVGCYACAELASRAVDYECIGREELDKIRKLSHSEAYETFPIEMYKKTPLKRLCKRLPLRSPQWQRLTELEANDGIASDPEPDSTTTDTAMEEEKRVIVQPLEPEPRESRDDINQRILTTWQQLVDSGRVPQLRRSAEHYASSEVDDDTAREFATFLSRELFKAQTTPAGERAARQ